MNKPALPTLQRTKDIKQAVKEPIQVFPVIHRVGDAQHPTRRGLSGRHSLATRRENVQVAMGTTRRDALATGDNVARFLRILDDAVDQMVAYHKRA